MTIDPVSRHVTAQKPWVTASAVGAAGAGDGPRTSVRPESVDVVIPVKTPNMEYLDLTLGSLELQTHAPNRVWIVDCLSPTVTVDTELPHHVLRGDRCHIASQRRVGVAASDAGVILHLDEDAVLTKAGHVEWALERLSEPGVSAVGGTVAPIRGNRVGKLTATLTPITAWFPMHERAICPDGSACFPSTRSVLGFHNDDTMLKRKLHREGRVVEEPSLVVLTDLPTRKQATAVVAAAGIGYAFLR